MKKLLVIISALMLAACAAPPANQPAPTANTNSAETPASATLSEADAIAKEKASWAALQKKDLDGFASMLDSDYIEVGDESASDKAAVLDYLKDLEITDVSFSDWKFMPIDNDAVLVTYNVTIKGSYKGKEVPPGPYRASAAWVNRAGKWLGIYYQETLAKKSIVPPMPATTPTAKNTPSPAAKTAEVITAEDPVSSEKLAWDALKRKDYDTFASFLDDAQIEVEPDGVFDKAGTLKGVRMFDASKYELTDFKTVSFDSDASLVTYVVKPLSPKEPLERSSTIWVKRNGKWRALFHQGTPASATSATAKASPSPSSSSSPKTSPSPVAKPPIKKP
jgi:hypothetical protein